MSNLGLNIKPLNVDKIEKNQFKRKGGKRPGSGRKPGHLSIEHITKIKTELELKERIIKNADRIFNAQVSIATGVQMLFKIVTKKVGKATVKSKPILVEDPEEIKRYLDGEFGDGDDVNKKPNAIEYYFITAERPNNQAIVNLWDRAFGKPNQSIDLSGNLTFEQVVAQMKTERGSKAKRI